MSVYTTLVCLKGSCHQICSELIDEKLCIVWHSAVHGQCQQCVIGATKAIASSLQQLVQNMFVSGMYATMKETYIRSEHKLPIAITVSILIKQTQ